MNPSPSRARRAPIWLIAAGVCVVLLTGCGSGSNEPDAAQGRPLTDALDYAARSDELGNQAIDMLVNACMKKAGFDYRRKTTTSVAVAHTEASLGFLGYTSLEEGPGGSGDGPEPHDGPPLSRAGLEALNGREERQDIVIDGVVVSSVQTDGCQAEAFITLSGGIDSYKADRVLVARIHNGLARAGNEAANSAEVRDAAAKWSQCMRGKGFAYDVPTDVVNARTPGVTLRSWKDAIADLDCKNETGYVATAEAAVATAERRYASANPGLVTEWKELMDARYQRVRDVLDGKLT
ncbi:MAG: hypothetical protein QM708_09065 [Propioniciclava sp.]|uniref:hypothetical protein n=1 Tax=Propioniciclava sp. TaxID=2038686 RepID=UPI0039E5A8D8